MKSKHFIFLAVLACAVSFFLGFTIQKEKITELRDTVVITKIDTLKIIQPVFITETITDTLLVPVLDTLIINDTIYQKLPITQRYYTEQAKYRAWVSGYKPRLDSIQIFNKTDLIYVDKIIQNNSKFGLGIIGGVGYSDKVSPFLGVGFYYSIWSIK